MRAVVKSHKYLKGTKVFAFGCLVRNFKKKLSLFIVNLQPGIVYKKSQSEGYFGELYQKETSTQRLLHKYFREGSEKIMNTTLNTSARLPLK